MILLIGLWCSVLIKHEVLMKCLQRALQIVLFSPQNLSQTHMLIDLIQEVKDKGYKLRISPTVDATVVPFDLHLFYFANTAVFSPLNELKYSESKKTKLQKNNKYIIFPIRARILSLGIAESVDGNAVQSGAADCGHVSLPSQHEGTGERPDQSQDPLQPALPEVRLCSS